MRNIFVRLRKNFVCVGKIFVRLENNFGGLKKNIRPFEKYIRPCRKKLCPFVEYIFLAMENICACEKYIFAFIKLIFLENYNLLYTNPLILIVLFYDISFMKIPTTRLTSYKHKQYYVFFLSCSALSWEKKSSINFDKSIYISMMLCAYPHDKEISYPNHKDWANLIFYLNSFIN